MSSDSDKASTASERHDGAATAASVDARQPRDMDAPDGEQPRSLSPESDEGGIDTNSMAADQPGPFASLPSLAQSLAAPASSTTSVTSTSDAPIPAATTAAQTQTTPAPVEPMPQEQAPVAPQPDAALPPGVNAEGPALTSEPLTQKQMNAITVGFNSSKPKQTLYTFPSPPPDTNDTLSEIEEFYSYVEIPQVIEHKDSFKQSWHHPKAFADMPQEVQMACIEHLLGNLSATTADARFTSARHLLYIAQGSFESSTSPEHHLHLIIKNARLLRQARVLPAVWEALKGANLRWEGFSNLADPEAPPESPQAIQERQDSLDEVNGELALHFAILYHMIEALRGDEEWADELMSLEPPMPVHLFHLVAGLREKNAKGYPVKKLLLLLWKSILCCIGGMKDVNRTKVLVREIEGLPADEKLKRRETQPITKVAPTDLQSFKTEIGAKYPSFAPPKIDTPLAADVDRLAAAAAPIPIRPVMTDQFGISMAAANGGGPSMFMPQPPTPAPSPPPALTQGGPKTKKQQYQTDQSRPFVLPFAPANAGPRGTMRSVPRAIDEAAELYRQNLRVSTDLWQTWKLREEYVADEAGLLRAEVAAKQKDKEDDLSKLSRRMEAIDLEDSADDANDVRDPLDFLQEMQADLKAKEEAETDTKSRQAIGERRKDLQRLERVELLYRMTLSQLQSAVIVLLKLLLATVTATNTNNPNGAGPADSGAEDAPQVELSLEDTDIMRHREITSKAVSAIIVLLLKWFKTSHVMKFHYLSQLLVDSNCLLLILKMFGLQEVATSIKSKHERAECNFFRYCHDHVNPSNGSEPRPEDAMLSAPPAGAWVPPTSSEDNDDVELISDYSWRNFFSTINFVHILQKLTKRKTHRILLLVQYKSSAILKRILKVSHPTLQLYTLKVIKGQVPYCGRKWRQSNMKVITAIYLHCRPDLRDEWLTGIDVDSDVEESLPHEQALRALVRFFNTKHYTTFAPHIHKRTESQAQAAAEFGGGGSIQLAPQKNEDVFPPQRSVSMYSTSEVEQEREADHSPFEHDDYTIDDLLSPRLDHDGGPVDWPHSSSRAIWDRLGDILGTYDEDISDSESVGSDGLLNLNFALQTEDEDREEQRDSKQDWSHISPDTINALEEEKQAATSPLSPRPRMRRQSTGPVSPALRPVLFDRYDEAAPSPVVDDEEEGMARAEPHQGPPVDEVELIFGQ